ncbi:MAG: arginyltransferase [Proteobacteria bacterium]|nr:arginyltransferase [Pseudomonadota bacterium]
MKHDPLHNARFFFATAPMPCPYLPGRIERRVVTELVGRDALAVHDQLSLAGFRRSHNIAYAPACPGCQACHAVRVRAGEFSPSRSHKRILNRNSHLRVEEKAPEATDEQFAVFAAYQDSRHAGGDMAKMDSRDYQALVEDTPVESSLVEFRHPDGILVAGCLVDRVENGLSAVYSFFDPELHRDSLGTYMILWMIGRARELNLRYVYLGFWIAGSSKMSYKAKFQPLEARKPDGWRTLTAEETGYVERKTAVPAASRNGL